MAEGMTIVFPNKEDIDNIETKIDELDAKVDELIDLVAADIDLTHYTAVQTLVRMGLADKIFAVGDQITVEKTESSSTVSLVFDVIGIDHEELVDSDYTHSVTLGLHNCYPSNAFVFDSSEALIYVDPDVFEDGLPAGNYAIRAYYSDNSASTTTDGYYYFTTTVDIPTGGQIIHSNLGTKTSVDDVVSGTFTTYESGSSTTALESGIATNYADPDEVSVSSGVMTYDGTEYTYLGMCTLQTYSRRTISGDENDGEDRSYINYIRRMNYGNNNYSVSNIRQWLNSDAAANAWFTPQTGFDRASSTVQAYAGFLNGIDSEFLSVLGNVQKTTAIPSCDNKGSVGTNVSEEFMFLISYTEAYCGNNSNIAEGSAYEYYSKFSDLSSAGTGNDTNRIKYRNSSASNWWFRSAYTGSSYYARCAATSGHGGNISSIISYGVVPACVII